MRHDRFFLPLLTRAELDARRPWSRWPRFCAWFGGLLVGLLIGLLFSALVS